MRRGNRVIQNGNRVQCQNIMNLSDNGWLDWINKFELISPNLPQETESTPCSMNKFFLFSSGLSFMGASSLKGEIAWTVFQLYRIAQRVVGERISDTSSYDVQRERGANDARNSFVSTKRSLAIRLIHSPLITIRVLNHTADQILEENTVHVNL